MSTQKPVPVMVVYHLKPGTEEKFKPLLAKHWPTLDKLGLVSARRPDIWRTEDKRQPGKLAYVEYMEWKDANASDTAHQSPEVMQIWEPMGAILENLQIMHLETAPI